MKWSVLPPTRAVAWRMALWVGLCWILLLLGPLSLLMLVLLPIAVLRSFRSRSVAVVCLMLANPLSFFFLRGVMDYAGGKPALLGMGLPGPEYANLDPATRCRRTSGGCVIHGHEWAVILPHNSALRLMVTVFGPPVGSYDGPYPKREEAVAAVSADGVPVSADQFSSGRIPTQAGEVRLDPAVMEKISMYLFPMNGYGMGEAFEGEELRASLWKERCLILRWKESVEGIEEKDRMDVVLLVDARGGKPFAAYQLAGRHSIRRAAMDVFRK